MADETVSVGVAGNIVIEDFYPGLSTAKISLQSHYTTEVKIKPKEMGSMFEDPVDDEEASAKAEEIIRSRRKHKIKEMLRDKSKKRKG